MSAREQPVRLLARRLDLEQALGDALDAVGLLQPQGEHPHRGPRGVQGAGLAAGLAEQAEALAHAVDGQVGERPHPGRGEEAEEAGDDLVALALPVPLGLQHPAEVADVVGDRAARGLAAGALGGVHQAVADLAALVLATLGHRLRVALAGVPLGLALDAVLVEVERRPDVSPLALAGPRHGGSPPAWRGARPPPSRGSSAAGCGS